MLPPATPDLAARSTLLLDADGGLMAAEEPVYVAAAGVRLQLLHRLGATWRWDVERLREEWRGRSFRRIVLDLAAEEGVRLSAAEVQDWVVREDRCVSARLGRTVRPDPSVRQALCRLSDHHVLVAAASSASARLDACLAAAGLDDLFPPERRFSGDDSLAVPASKPDPALHLHALLELGVQPADALAVESTRCGVRAALAAELPVVGILAHVPGPERAARRAALMAAGALTVVDDWPGLAALLAARPREAAVPAPRQVTEPIGGHGVTHARPARAGAVHAEGPTFEAV